MSPKAPTVEGVARVGHDLEIKQPPPCYYYIFNFKKYSEEYHTEYTISSNTFPFHVIWVAFLAHNIILIF